VHADGKAARPVLERDLGEAAGKPVRVMMARFNITVRFRSEISVAIPPESSRVADPSSGAGTS
jgi:hypothetical protein